MKFIFEANTPKLEKREFNKLYEGKRTVTWRINVKGEEVPAIKFEPEDELVYVGLSKTVICHRDGGIWRSSTGDIRLPLTSRIRPLDKSLDPDIANEIYKAMLDKYEQRWYLCSEKLPPDPIEFDGTMLSNASLLVAFDTGHPTQGELSEDMYMGKGKWLGDSERYPIYAWYDNEGLNFVWGMLNLMFGEYGSSPRSGWFFYSKELVEFLSDMNVDLKE